MVVVMAIVGFAPVVSIKIHFLGDRKINFKIRLGIIVLRKFPGRVSGIFSTQLLPSYHWNNHPGATS